MFLEILCMITKEALSETFLIENFIDIYDLKSKKSKIRFGKELLNKCFFVIFVTGHMIQEVPEFPLVVSDKIQEYNKTKQAVIFLRRIKAWNDIQKVRF